MANVIYFIQRDSDSLIKIGTTKNLKQRLAAIKQDAGDIKLLGVIKGSRVREKMLHWCFAGQRVEGEWFKPDGELLDMIGEYASVPKITQAKATKKKRAAYTGTGRTLVSLSKFNHMNKSANEIARTVNVSWPLVSEYLEGGKQQASISHVALVLSGMGVDWRNIKLGDLLVADGAGDD